MIDIDVKDFLTAKQRKNIGEVLTGEILKAIEGGDYVHGFLQDSLQLLSDSDWLYDCVDMGKIGVKMTEKICDGIKK
jgi:hypothetical protein